MRLGARVGQGCENVHNRYMRDLQVNLIELDEQWDFIQKKTEAGQDWRSGQFGRRLAVCGLGVHPKGRAELSGRQAHG